MTPRRTVGICYPHSNPAVWYCACILPDRAHTQAHPGTVDACGVCGLVRPKNCMIGESTHD